jgi:hypothetical protein
MGLKHKVCINVTGPSGKKETVIKGGVKSIPRRLLTALLGENTEILVLTPGQSVQSVEIHEIKEGGKNNESNQTAP